MKPGDTCLFDDLSIGDVFYVQKQPLPRWVKINSTDCGLESDLSYVYSMLQSREFLYIYGGVHFATLVKNKANETPLTDLSKPDTLTIRPGWAKQRKKNEN
jgi:hypothetical protein